MTVTTVFVDKQLWKNKTLAETFLSVLRVIDRSDRNSPITGFSPSDLFYVMLAGCDWWISIWYVDNTMEILETFQRVCCFPKLRINENGGNIANRVECTDHLISFHFHAKSRLNRAFTTNYYCEINYLHVSLKAFQRWGFLQKEKCFTIWY